MDSDSSGRKEKRMKQNLPTRREMKFLAKRLMMHPICMRVTGEKLYQIEQKLL